MISNPAYQRPVEGGRQEYPHPCGTRASPVRPADEPDGQQLWELRGPGADSPRHGRRHPRASPFAVRPAGRRGGVLACHPPACKGHPRPAGCVPRFLRVERRVQSVHPCLLAHSGVARFG
eukprot:2620688-Prymnesium_polylepis.2